MYFLKLKHSSEYLQLLLQVQVTWSHLANYRSLQLNETKTKNTHWQSFTSLFISTEELGASLKKKKNKTHFLNTCSENKPFRSTLSAKPTQHSANKGLSPERSLHNTEPSPHSQESLGRGLDVSTHSHDTSVCTLLIFSQRNIQKRAKILQRMNCISTQRSCIAYPATSRS